VKQLSACLRVALPTGVSPENRPILHASLPPPAIDRWPALRGDEGGHLEQVVAEAGEDHLHVTPANVHDSRVDLSRPGETVYRDKGYYGVKPRDYDATTKQASRGHPLTIRDRLRNRRINRRRAPGERPFAVLKRVFAPDGHPHRPLARAIDGTA